MSSGNSLTTPWLAPVILTMLSAQALCVDWSYCPKTGHDTWPPQVEAPSFEPQDGTEFRVSLPVVLGTPTEGATIRYTTNGDDPTESTGTLYDALVPVSGTVTIKAIACKDGMSCSEVVEATYTRLPMPSLLGDTNADHTVNALDLLTMGRCWNAHAESANWNAACDFNGDNCINAIDLLSMARNWGKSLQPLEVIAVGNPGNPPDATGYGSVDYTYHIGKYEITAGQYCEFLNAVAATDTYGLYSEDMWTHDYGCKIQRSGSEGSYIYSVASDWADRPVNCVSWGDAARYCNWLTNGRPTGLQNLTTTEDGSYYLNGATSDAALLAVTREPGARYVIPSEDEWYKAAYHKNDGATGNYWVYPTSSDSGPGRDMDETSKPGNNANYYDNGLLIGSPYYRTLVGEFELSDSPYGTFDQAGNLWEWNEAVVDGTHRGLRGGCFHNHGADKMVASHRHGNTPAYEDPVCGLRIARLDEQEFVTVGNPGNPPDATGYGSVDYVYLIGKYEITAGQYCEFLNAVAATDTYGLYSESMWTDEYGCKIQRSGSAGNYIYSVAIERFDRPVNYVSWGDAARFCNWLTNGKPTGAQNLSTTEDGSYYLNGATSYGALVAVTRKAGARYVIPTEDEWYKAAYHKNDGATGNYWIYPTGSDSAPGFIGDGESITNPDPGNYATYNGDGGTHGIGSPYYRTEVGEHENSAAPYGTYDQGGNVWEWNETAVTSSYRGLRGGSFDDFDYNLRASRRHYYYPTFEGYSSGFRVSEVP